MSPPRTHSDRDRRSSRTALILIGIVALTGLGLRLWRLSSFGDLDFDEQASSFIGSMDPLAMLGYLVHAPFEHPPLFYLLFHFWLLAFGESETAMRVFAVLPGVATIVIVGMAVAGVASWRGGLVAAVIVALSPLQVFESRDARMYTLLALVMALLTTSLVRSALGRPDRAGRRRLPRGLAPVGLAAVGLATHYYAFFGVLGAGVGLWHGTRTRSRGRISHPPLLAPGHDADGARSRLGASPGAWLAALALVGIALGVVWLLLAPGLRTSLTAAYPRWIDPRTLGATVLQSFGAHVVGPLASPDRALAAGALVAVLVAGCAWVSLGRAEDGAGRARGIMSRIALWGFLFTTVGVPALAILGRAYAPRFVSLATPFLAILVGCAVASLPRRWVWAGIGLYAAACVPFLVPMLTSYTRSDYGHALAALRAEARPDDAIVLNGPWQELLYRRYGKGLPPGTIIASTVPLQPEESIGWLQRLTATHPRLWVVDSASDAGDPNGVVAGWLDTHAYPRPVVPFDKALLRPYLTDYDGAPALSERAVDVSALGLHIVSAAAGQWSLAPGGETRLKLHARLTDRSAASRSTRRIAAELIAPDGSSVWSWDGPLTDVGGELEYRAAIVVPPDAVAGSYSLRAVVYIARVDGAGHRQIVRIADPLPLADVPVTQR